MWVVISVLCICIICGVVGVLVYRNNQKRIEGVVKAVKDE
jgi:hypothetical protein